MRAKTLPVGDDDVTRTCYPDVVVPLVWCNTMHDEQSVHFDHMPKQYTAIFPV